MGTCERQYRRLRRLYGRPEKRAYVNPGLAWVEIVPPIEKMPALTYGLPVNGAPPLPTNRWVINGELSPWSPPMTLDQRIRVLASYYLGWKYSYQGAKTAVMSQGIPPNVYDPTARVTNCSLMSASILIAAHPEVDWTLENWRQLMVYGVILVIRPFRRALLRASASGWSSFGRGDGTSFKVGSMQLADMGTASSLFRSLTAAT